MLMNPKTTPTPKTISSIKIVIFSLVPVIFLLIMGELTLRVWANHYRTSYERYNYTSGRLELVPNIRFTASNGAEFLINSKGFVGPEFDDHKPN